MKTGGEGEGARGWCPLVMAISKTGIGWVACCLLYVRRMQLSETVGPKYSSMYVYIHI